MRMEVSRQIAAPPEHVFALASDFAHAADHVQAIERVELLTPPPVGVGTRFRETRKVFGRSATEELAVTEFEPPRRYVVGCDSHGCRYRSEFLFTPRGGGTEVRLTFEAQPLNLIARIMGFLMRPLVKKVVAECAKDLDDIAAAAESRRA